MPFHIKAQLITSVQAVGPSDPFNPIGPIDAGIFYGNTAALTGVKAFDGNKNPLDSFTILSASGTDYINIPQVPEPVTGAMMIVGLGLVARTARCRRADGWRAKPINH